MNKLLDRAFSDRSAVKGPVILIVAMPNSIHSSRWVNMVCASGARIVLVGVSFVPADKDPRWIKVRSRFEVDALPAGAVGLFDLHSVDRGEAAKYDLDYGYEHILPLTFTDGSDLVRPLHIARAIEFIKPDLVHTLEIQLAGYMTLEVKRRLGLKMPPWLLSNWGSDLYLYHKLKTHRLVIIELMRNIDGYLAECRRDIPLAHQLGFRGRAFDPMPASGGMDFESFPKLETVVRPSKRKTILVKGYHGWAGRGMHILSAIHLAADALRGFKIRVLFGTAGMADMVEAIAAEDGLDIALAPYTSTHKEALNRLSDARLVVGMGISDGISTTLLEAMSFGAFPIQGDTSCACEWVRNGVDGIVCGPHDVEGLSKAITRAALDDALVDAAAPRNRQHVEEHWNVRLNGPRAVGFYQELLGMDRDPAAGVERRPEIVS